MNKLIYWLLLGILSGAIFFFGAFGVFAADNLAYCQGLSKYYEGQTGIDSDVVIQNCLSYEIHAWMQWFLAFICFILQIILTKKGWSER